MKESDRVEGPQGRTLTIAPKLGTVTKIYDYSGIYSYYTYKTALIDYDGGSRQLELSSDLKVIKEEKEHD